MSQKTRFVIRFLVVAVLLGAIAVFVNAVSGRADLGRFDLTADRIYTVSPAAKNVLGGLRVPVQVKFYITARDKMPSGLENLERDVVEKLREFQVISNGNLQFSVVDPSEDDELAEKIAEKGIRPFQTQSIERDAMALKLVYASMEISYLDKDPEVIPQVLPQTLTTLEYEVCAAVSKLTRDMDPVVAVYASKEQLDPQMLQLYMQMGQQPPEPKDVFQTVVQLLRQEGYDVRRTDITEASPIPEEASTLLLLAPRDLNERQRYEINRFGNLGGNIVVATQNYQFNYTPARRGGFSFTANRINSGLDELLAGWGVSVSEDLLMDDNNQMLSVPSQQTIGGMRFQTSEPVAAPMQIMVTRDQMVEGTSIVAGVSDLLYLWGSRLSLDDDVLAEADLEANPLFTTSGTVWEVPYTPGPLPMSAMVMDPDSELGFEPLGVLVRGDLPNQFAEGDKPAWPGAASDSTSTVEEVEEFVPVSSSLVVFGASKLFEDSFLSSLPGNMLLLRNTVDALALGEDIIQIRAKTATVRSIEPLSYRAKVAWRLVTMALVPLIVIIVGIVRWVSRKREETAFLVAQRSATAS